MSGSDSISIQITNFFDDDINIIPTVQSHWLLILFGRSVAISCLISLSGGVFRVYLKFDEHFNQKPPRICFHTIPYHPNIDMITGRPCIDFIDNSELWNTKISVASVLVHIQVSGRFIDNVGIVNF